MIIKHIKHKWSQSEVVILSELVLSWLGQDPAPSNCNKFKRWMFVTHFKQQQNNHMLYFYLKKCNLSFINIVDIHNNSFKVYLIISQFICSSERRAFSGRIVSPLIQVTSSVYGCIIQIQIAANQQLFNILRKYQNLITKTETHFAWVHCTTQQVTLFVIKKHIKHSKRHKYHYKPSFMGHQYPITLHEMGTK